MDTSVAQWGLNSMYNMIRFVLASLGTTSNDCYSSFKDYLQLDNLASVTTPMRYLTQDFLMNGAYDMYEP